MHLNLNVSEVGGELLTESTTTLDKPKPSLSVNRRLLALLGILVLSLCVFTSRVFGSAQKLANVLDEDSEATKLLKDEEVFPHEDEENGLSTTRQTSSAPTQAPRTSAPTNRALLDEIDLGQGGSGCPELGAGKVTIESLVDPTKSVDEDHATNKITLDHAHELWSFIAEGMPSTTGDDKETSCRKERWRRAVKRVSLTEDDELTSYMR